MFAGFKMPDWLPTEPELAAQGADDDRGPPTSAAVLGEAVERMRLRLEGSLIPHKFRSLAAQLAKAAAGNDPAPGPLDLDEAAAELSHLAARSQEELLDALEGCHENLQVGLALHRILVGPLVEDAAAELEAFRGKVEVLARRHLKAVDASVRQTNKALKVALGNKDATEEPPMPEVAELSQPPPTAAWVEDGDEVGSTRNRPDPDLPAIVEAAEEEESPQQDTGARLDSQSQDLAGDAEPMDGESGPAAEEERGASEVATKGSDQEHVPVELTERSEEAAAGAPEAEAREPEAAAVVPDAQEPEAAAGAPEAEAREPEAAAVVPDVQEPEVAAGLPEAEAREPEEAAVVPDAQEPEAAAGAPAAEAREPEAAAGAPEAEAREPEAAAVVPDAQEPEAAAGAPEAEAREPEAAAGVQEAAAGLLEAEAGPRGNEDLVSGAEGAPMASADQVQKDDEVGLPSSAEPGTSTLRVHDEPPAVQEFEEGKQNGAAPQLTQDNLEAGAQDGGDEAGLPAPPPSPPFPAAPFILADWRRSCEEGIIASLNRMSATIVEYRNVRAMGVRVLHHSSPSLASDGSLLTLWQRRLWYPTLWRHCSRR